MLYETLRNETMPEYESVGCSDRKGLRYFIRVQPIFTIEQPGPRDVRELISENHKAPPFVGLHFTQQCSWCHYTF